MARSTATDTSIPYAAMRLATGLSQRELERRLGWQNGWVSQLEHGYRHPDRERELKALLGRLLTAAS
jgi:transcriptional regulator with XRE-family HTH domain